MSDIHPKYQLLLKEIELIQGNIHNLDNIIFKMKNFTILLWGGSVGLIVRFLATSETSPIKDHIPQLLMATALIPLVFWIIHARWQKHIHMSSKRERMISFFINSPDFDAWLKGKSGINFPLYDAPGWIYTEKAVPKEKKEKPEWAQYGFKVDEKYLLNHDNSQIWKLMWYKDAAWYYPIMLGISFITAYWYYS